MRTIVRGQWFVIIGLALLIPLSSAAAEKKEGSSGHQTTIQQKPSIIVNKANKKHKKNTGCKETLHNDSLSKPRRMPVYRPPLRGAPSGRVAGGTRGFGQKFPCLCALVPEHVGLTVSEQPRLYYFLSEATNLPLEFTIILKRAVYPLIETRIRPPQTAGIHAICLADYGQQLKPGIQYKWFVALIPNEEHRSSDILASGAIELVASRNDLRERLKKTSDLEATYVYAESGIWYDALATLSAAIEKKPGDSGLIQQRASLLEQVGLSEVAQYESQRLMHK